MTLQQQLFPKKPKDVITPLTPPTTAAAIRAKYAPKPTPAPAPEPTQQEAALEELEGLANQLTTKRTKKGNAG